MRKQRLFWICLAMLNYASGKRGSFQKICTPKTWTAGDLRPIFGSGSMLIHPLFQLSWKIFQTFPKPGKKNPSTFLCYLYTVHKFLSEKEKKEKKKNVCPAVRRELISLRGWARFTKNLWDSTCFFFFFGRLKSFRARDCFSRLNELVVKNELLKET